MIRTAAPEGANLLIQHVAARGLSYSVRYGQVEPYAGWYAAKYNEMVERVGVAVEWAGADDQLLVTLLYPFRGQGTGVLSLEPLLSLAAPDDLGYSEGFRLLLADGLQVSYRAARLLAKLECEPVTIEGGALLVVQPPEGPTYGLAQSCMVLYLNGERQTLTGSNDLTFEIGRDGLRVTGAIGRPGPARGK